MLRRIGLALPPHRRVFAAFFVYAFGMGGIFPRLADIQRALGVAEGTFGLALIGTATGTLLSLSFAGPWLERFGHRRALLVAIPLMAGFFAIAALARNPWALYLCLLPAGLCIGAIEIIVNLEADRVEHQSGRRLMNRAHAFWSFGFFAAGLLGAALSQAGVDPAVHLAAALVGVVLAVPLVLGRFEAAQHRTQAAGEPSHRFARPTLAILVLVVLTLSALMMEGAGADWSAIYMRDVFGAAPFVAGVAVAVGALAQALARYVADGFVERHGALAVARVLLVVLGAGTAVIFTAGSASLALLGFALMGIGTSAIFPLAMSAAAQRTDRPAATNVAALAQTSFVAFLLGPPLLGFVAELWGIRWAFGIGLPLVLLSLLASGALARGRAAAGVVVRR